DQRAPSIPGRIECMGYLFQLLLSPEERLQSREVVGHGRRGSSSLPHAIILCIIVPFAPLIESEALENQDGGALRRFLLQVGITRQRIETLALHIAESGQHHLL